MRKSFQFADFEITIREILASITIIAAMMIIGIMISGKITESQADRNEVYNKALKIENEELFKHGLETNIGNAFVYGELKAVDTVTYPEIGGEYIWISKVKEKYTKHTRTVTYTDSNGKKKTKTETYWTWDQVDSECKKSKQISFCGVIFDIDKIDIPGSHHIETIKESSRIRYKYYGVDTKFVGTIFADLRDNTISDSTDFYNNLTIEDTVARLHISGGEIVFWIFWIILIAFTLFGFYYLDNRWLD